jgi:exonuclease-1
MQNEWEETRGSAQMGISGLLPLLRSITKRVHIEALAGEAVAIDAYSWLHKGVFLCSADLFHERPTNG